jgi:hypothetical protein
MEQVQSAAVRGDARRDGRYRRALSVTVTAPGPIRPE